MRDVLGVTWLRRHHWMILLGAIAYAVIYLGLFDLRGAASYLANRPEVSQAFTEPHFGRADAIILVFSTLFLGPLALAIGLLALVFVLAVCGARSGSSVCWRAPAASSSTSPDHFRALGLEAGENRLDEGVLHEAQHRLQRARFRIL